MSKAAPRITGSSLPGGAFRLHETSGTIDVDTVFEVLGGNLAAYLVQGFLGKDVCRRIESNFWTSTERVPRYGAGEDGVEAYLIGASHYGKPTKSPGTPSRRFQSDLLEQRGHFLLEPHDDLAQVKDPIQADFEIQQVKRVLAKSPVMRPLPNFTKRCEPLLRA